MYLEDIYPSLESEFDNKLNKGIDFHKLTIGSRLRVWWRCPNGPDHIWLASVNQRTSGRKLSGCPACVGKKVVKSNCLATTHPDIAGEWYYEKNLPLNAHEITAGSNKKVW